MIGMARQTGPGDPRNFRRAGEKFRDDSGIGDMAGNAQRQRFQPLQQVERRLRRHAGAEIAQPLGARAHDEGGRPEFLGKIETVIAGIGFGQGREPTRTFPVEAAAIDEHAADRHAVTADPFRRRMHDDVGAVLDRPDQAGRGEGRIDHQRQAGNVGDGGNRRDVEHLEAGIAQRLGEDQPRLGPDRRGEGCRVARIDHRRRDAEARQGMVEQIVAAAIDVARGDDVAAGIRQRQHRQRQRRLAARRGDRTDAAFERGNALFEHGHRRIRDPAVDVARTFEVEQAGGVIDVRKDIGGRLIDRRCARPGDRVRVLACMQAQRIEFKELRIEHGTFPQGRRGRPI